MDDNPPPFLEAEFVGEPRHQIVDGLLKVFHQCVTNSTPRWVSLEGPSGCGKSRVVREFYARLAQSQPNPHYWSESLISTDSPDVISNVHVRRKKTIPRSQGLPDAWPSYMWWGVACLDKHGSSSETLAVSLNQFTEHAVFLDKAYAVSAKNPAKLDNLLNNMKEAVTEEGSAELFQYGADKFAAFVTDRVLEEVPGVGTLIRTTKWSWNKFEEYRHREDTVKHGKVVDENISLEPVEEAIETIKHLAGKSVVPVIIFVEDLHDADRAFVLMLERLLRQENMAVMVITTTWVAELEQRESLYPLNRLFKWEWLVGDKYHRVTEEEADTGSPVRGSFAVLPRNAKVQFIESCVPGIEKRIAGQLADRYEQPLLLELVLAMDWIKEDFGQTLEDLSDEAIAELPYTLDDYYTTAWERLPDSAKDTLVYAAVGVPHLIDPDTTRQNREWSLSLLRDSLDAANISHTMLEKFSDEPRILGWANEVGDKLSEFREWHHLEFASDNKITTDRQIEILKALAEQASDALMNNTTGFGKYSYLETLVLSLASTSKVGKRRLKERLITSREIIAKAARLKFYALANFPREINECIRLGHLYLNNVEDWNSAESLNVRVIVGKLIRESGDNQTAVEFYRKLLSDQERILGPDHQSTLRTLNNLASSIGRSSEKPSAKVEALKIFYELIQKQVRMHSADSLFVFAIRSNIAYWTSKTGDPRKALAMFQHLLSDMRRSLDVDHPDILNVRRNIGDLVYVLGDSKKSLELLQTLLSDRERVQGSDHPDTLSNRGRIAFIKSAIGDAKGALATFQNLFLLRERILGADHPDTLTTRSNIAINMSKIGDEHGALEILEKLLPDFERVLGADHPSTLRARNKIAVGIGAMGDSHRALELLIALLPDRERALGVDHKETFNTRTSIASFTSDDAQSLALYEKLYTDKVRVFGPNNPDTIRTKKAVKFLSDRLKN